MADSSKIDIIGVALSSFVWSCLVVICICYIDLLIHIVSPWSEIDFVDSVAALSVLGAIALVFGIAISGAVFLVLLGLCAAFRTPLDEILAKLYPQTGLRLRTDVLWLVGLVGLIVVTNIISESTPREAIWVAFWRLSPAIPCSIFVLGSFLVVRFRPSRAPSFGVVLLVVAIFGQWVLLTQGPYFIPFELLWGLIPFAVVMSVAIALWLRTDVRKVAPVLALLCVSSIVFGFYYHPTERRAHQILMAEATFAFPALQLLRGLADFDGDGYGAWYDDRDCAPSDGEIHLGALELPDNDIDENCVGGDLRSWAREPNSGDGKVANRLNVLLITIDTLRGDALGKEFGGRPLTPSLNRFSAQSANFTHAFAASTHTNESVPSIFAGTYPSDWSQSGLYFGLEPPIARVLSDNGFETFGVISLPLLNLGMLDGFQDVDNSLGENADTVVTGEALTKAALARLDRRDKTKPFFGWVHYFDPHATYYPMTKRETPNPVPPPEESHYWHEVERTDIEFGKLIDGIRQRGLLENTVVIVTSDHGEGLGAHRLETHLYLGTRQVLHVPLLIWIPGMSPIRFDQPVSHVDIAPTVFDILKANDAGARNGMSLKPAIDGANVERGPIFFEATDEHDGPLLRGVVADGYKFWFDWNRNAYYLHRLEGDEEERRLISDDALWGRMHQLLWSWWDRQYSLPAMEFRAERWERFRKPRMPIYTGPEFRTTETSKSE